MHSWQGNINRMKKPKDSWKHNNTRKNVMRKVTMTMTMKKMIMKRRTTMNITMKKMNLIDPDHLHDKEEEKEPRKAGSTSSASLNHPVSGERVNWLRIGF
jgi:hypothetical protein